MGQRFEGEETLNINEASKAYLESDAENTCARVYPDAILNIAHEPASVFQMKRKWEKKPLPMLNLSPSFQRENVWSERKKCELIESIIMGIPLPAFYVKEDVNGVYIVVDGKQRLSTLFDFINGKFKLKGLSILESLNTKSFDDLTPIQQNKIEDYPLQLNIIKPPTSDRVILDLFDRVNRGGVTLNNQEMRNALYQGTATELLNELAICPEFICATEKAAAPKHMKDRYMILRFIAFYLWNERISLDVKNAPLQYKSNMEDFLGETMKFINRYSRNDSFILSLENLFKDTMRKACEYILPCGGFRLPSKEGGKKRPINMVFFESLCYLLAKMQNPSKDMVQKLYSNLLKNDKYVDSLTHFFDNRMQIETRYEIIKSMI